MQKIQAPAPIAVAEEPHHDTICDMIHEIGLMENKISETEYPMDGWRLDGAWKRVSAGFPSHAFEVQVGSNFYEALSKLKHAHDIWNSKPILVTTGKYAVEARDLLQGSFHEIRDVASIVDWKRVSRLCELLKEAEAIKKDVGLLRCGSCQALSSLAQESYAIPSQRFVLTNELTADWRNPVWIATPLDLLHRRVSFNLTPSRHSQEILYQNFWLRYTEGKVWVIIARSPTPREKPPIVLLGLEVVKCHVSCRFVILQVAEETSTGIYPPCHVS
jgi:hypothetical protein